jgi:GNAT superfamily N-acetyltransferase
LKVTASQQICRSLRVLAFVASIHHTTISHFTCKAFMKNRVESTDREMKVDFEQNDTPSGCFSTATATSISTSSLMTTTTPSNEKCPDNSGSTIIIVPFERHRQDEVATLFQNGLLSYDFTGNEAWKVVNEWFVADRLSKEMKDVYTGFNMAADTAASDAVASKEQEANTTSFEGGLHFMTAIDSLTDQVVGCVGIKRPDQHTLAVLRQNMPEQQLSVSSKEEAEEKSNYNEIFTTTACCELVRLSVDQTCRRRGIGKRLVHAVEQFAQRHGYRCICLTTLLVQTHAVALYQSCGYSITHQEALPSHVVPQQQQSENINNVSLVYLCKQLDV